MFFLKNNNILLRFCLTDKKKDYIKVNKKEWAQFSHLKQFYISFYGFADNLLCIASI